MEVTRYCVYGDLVYGKDRFGPVNKCPSDMEPERPFYVVDSHFDRVTAERDALQQRLNAVEEENDRLRTQLARMIGQAENMLEIAGNCSDPDEDDDGNFDECREYIKSAEKALENRS